LDVQDAATAALAFQAWFESSPRPPSDVTAVKPLCTLGAAALWAGWSQDLSLLHAQVLVLWPNAILGAGVGRHGSTEANAAAALMPAPEMGSASDATPSASAFEICCGDTHSVWLKHQKGPQVAAFQELRSVLATTGGGGRKLEVSFDGGVSWMELHFRGVSDAQISWRGHPARATKRETLTLQIRRG
jgi:hypothetical protein